MTQSLEVASGSFQTEDTGKGGISISSDPANAKIYVNNVLEGNSPLTLDFSPGIYNILAKKKGYKSKKETIRIRSGKRLKITLILDKSGGSIWIRSNPENAKIYLNMVQKKNQEDKELAEMFTDPNENPFKW